MLECTRNSAILSARHIVSIYHMPRSVYISCWYKEKVERNNNFDSFRECDIVSELDTKMYNHFEIKTTFHFTYIWRIISM